MYIKELTSIPAYKDATISINYDEARDIANGLYYASKERKEFEAIYAKCAFIFDMVKHGMIQEGTVTKMGNLQNKEKKKEDEKSHEK